MSSSSPSPSPNMFDILIGVGCATSLLCWIVYRVNKCIIDGNCVKARQIFPVETEEIHVPRVTFQVDAEVATTLSDDSDAIYVEAYKDNIVSKPPLTSNIVEYVDLEIQPVTIAVQIN